MNSKNNWFERFIHWRETHISNRQFILILSLLVGIACALAAYVLKQLIHLIQTLLTSGFISSEANFLYLLYPVIGIFLTWCYQNSVCRFA